MPCDVLRLRNMRFFAYHGLFPQEGELGQRFEVDLEIHRDLSGAGNSDQVEDTVDYQRVYRLVEEVVTGRRFKLVEALAEHVAQAVGQALAPVRLTVRVRKPHPPVAAHFDGVEVELQRSYG
jgi:dihydroneopterin aldolase